MGGITPLPGLHVSIVSEFRVGDEQLGPLLSISLGRYGNIVAQAYPMADGSLRAHSPIKQLHKTDYRSCGVDAEVICALMGWRYIPPKQMRERMAKARATTKAVAA